MAVQIIGNQGGAPPQTTAPKAVAVPRPILSGTPEKSEPPPQQASRTQLEQAVKEIRKSMSQGASSDLQFSIDDDTGITVVRVTDKSTGELIRQIPSLEVLELAKSLDSMKGMLLRQQV